MQALKFATISAVVATLALASASVAQDVQSKLTKQMGIDQKLGAWLPQEAKFKDESGKDVVIKDYLGERPVILIPIFYRCKTMCVVIADSLAKTLAKATRTDSLKPGRDFEVLMISINPKETPELAMAKKIEIFNMLTPPKGSGEDVQWRQEVEKGWHLLTGSYDQIRLVTDAVGFKYGYDEKRDLINHPAAAMLVTPEGQVSSYVIGSTFPTKVLETGLAMAEKNEIGVKADQSFMFGCIMVDPNTGKYTIVVERVLQIGCILTVIILAASIATMGLRERRKAKETGGVA